MWAAPAGASHPAQRSTRALATFGVGYSSDTLLLELGGEPFNNSRLFMLDARGHRMGSMKIIPNCSPPLKSRAVATATTRDAAAQFTPPARSCPRVDLLQSHSGEVHGIRIENVHLIIAVLESEIDIDPAGHICSQSL